MKQFAIVGLGRWGKVLISEFDKLVDVVYAVHLGDEKNAYWLNKNYPNIKTSTDIKSVLSNKDICTVIIASPVKTHYKIAKLCLDNNKNVFIEKPPCLNTNEGFRLMRLAERKNLTIFVDNVHSFDPAFRKLKTTIGKIRPSNTSFIWLKWGTFDTDILWNLAYHDIYLAHILYGKPKESRATFKSANKIEIELVYENQTVSLSINRTHKGLPSKKIFVNFDSIIISIENSNLYKIQNGKRKLIFRSNKSPLGIACRKFLSQLDGKRKDYADFIRSVDTVKTIQDIIKKS